MSGPGVFAATKSRNTLSFHFSYEGRQRATLGIHKYRGRPWPELMLFIECGQIICSHDDLVRVAFDDEHPINVPCTEADDGDMTIVFLEDERCLISKMLNASVLYVEQHS